MRGVRLGWVLAVVLGVYLGLSFAACDTDNTPDAQDGGEAGPTGTPRSSLGQLEGADCRPGFVIASGKLGESIDPVNKYWNVGGVTIMVAPHQIPGDAQLRRFDGSIVEIIVREVR